MTLKFAFALGVCMLSVACAQPYSQSPESANLRQSSLNLVNEMADANAQIYSASGPEKVESLALESVRTLLKDPDSAQFRRVEIVPFADGQVVCGEVNAKNSYGGYVGFTPFVAGGGLAVLWDESRYQELERDANAGLIAACAG